MLSKILSEKDIEIHKFVNNLEMKLEEKERVLLELKGQNEELQSDFKYNLSLLRERDQELVDMEKVLKERDTEILKRNAEIKRLKEKLTEEEEKTKDLKNCLQEQQEFHSLNLTKTKQEFQEKFYTKDKEELVYTERIKELSNRIKEKDEELAQQVIKNHLEQKNISEKNLLEIVNIRASFEEKIQELQELLQKQGFKISEKEFLLQDLTLQNDLKYKKIIMLEGKIGDFEISKHESEEEKRQLSKEISLLENRIKEIEEETQELIAAFNLKERESARNVEELDEIISGLSQRNEFLKKEFTDKIVLMEEEIKEVVLENKVLIVKLEQEKSIKESEKEIHLRNQEEISGNLKAKANELSEFKDKIKALESDLRLKSQQLEKVNCTLKDLELENQDFKRRLTLDEIGWNKKLNEIREKSFMLELQDRDKEIELSKLRTNLEDMEREKLGLLKKIQEFQESGTINDDAKVQELEATNEQLSSVIHQMRIDMENLQEEFKVSQDKGDNIISQDLVPNDDLLKQNNFMKSEISDMHIRLKKLTVEKNRLVDISNSVRSHIRNWKEAQENRYDKSTQTSIVLNAVESKDGTSSRNPKVLRQSDKETASQNKSRTKLSKPAHTIKTRSGESPEKFQEFMQNRALGIRNWNNIHD